MQQRSFGILLSGMSHKLIHTFLSLFHHMCPQVGIKWVPKVTTSGVVSKLKPINFYNFIGPGNVDNNDQKTLIVTFQAPTDHDSIYWYTGRMPHGGEMLRNKMHIHNKVFKEYLLIKATPSELGLTKANNFIPKKPYLTLDLHDIGFANLDDVRAFVLKNLENAGKVCRC